MSNTKELTDLYKRQIKALKRLIYLTGPDYIDPDIPGSNYAYRGNQRTLEIQNLRSTVEWLDKMISGEEGKL